ncbi:hypothetical protein [Amycolatopsis sp. 195334CR]|uniref:hypothetical protein n=1 Tax=Amycolatopsis sp. 195334CR TaxID=2814588 RepID=UPI001A9015BD|nr:hypothetical protein [Amycolatopsis sp. 195334CR]MBN6037639.1 hypothetical protein [Amycolatopsis sp. 195334CR]
MTGPGMPGQYPPQQNQQYSPHQNQQPPHQQPQQPQQPSPPGQPSQSQQPQHQQFQSQQQYPQQHHPHYGQGYPPPKRKLGLLIGVLATVFVLILAGVGIWVFTANDEPDGPPPIDASQDVEKSLGGCAVFDEHEVKAYIPGRMTFKPTGSSSSSDAREQGQCNWSNTDTWSQDKVPAAHLIVTSYHFRATRTESGVDAAKEHYRRSAQKGAAVNVRGADEALITVNKTSADVTARYRNVVYKFEYSNKSDGANVSATATELANVAIAKVVPDPR